MSDTARQLLPWILSRQPEAVPSIFSLRDLLWLGRPRLEAAQLGSLGHCRRRDRRPPRSRRCHAPRRGKITAGRSEAGQVTTQVPDLTLRLVEETAELQLPAALVPALLAFALEDYWHDVQRTLC